jgi:hypothetical protein
MATEAYQGFLTLYDPSSTTYVKHFTANTRTRITDCQAKLYTAGYINTDAAIDEISFKFSAAATSTQEQYTCTE